jgi:hypothetical protein
VLYAAGAAAPVVDQVLRILPCPPPKCSWKLLRHDLAEMAESSMPRRKMEMLMVTIDGEC